MVEGEILETLRTIQAYIFVIMLAVVVWVGLKFVHTLIHMLDRSMKVMGAHFSKEMRKFLNEGSYAAVISECKKKLEKQPNHLDANWHVARAYYYSDEDALAKKHFEKAKHLEPNWEDAADGYLSKIQRSEQADADQPTAAVDLKSE